MALKIDSPTLSVWNAAGISSVRVRFVRGGCAGTKVSVTPAESADSVLPCFEVSGIAVHFEDADRSLLQDARLTRMEKNGKEIWLYVA